jgi:hypothetical protein
LIADGVAVEYASRQSGSLCGTLGRGSAMITHAFAVEMMSTRAWILRPKDETCAKHGAMWCMMV